MLKTLVGSMEPRLVFFPYKGEDANPGILGLPYQQLTLSTSDGERIVAWQLEPDNPRADVVYFHGNGGNLSVWLPVLASLHRLDYRVLAVDYRGYGLSTGTPTEEGVYRDAEAVVRHAAANRATGRRMIFWGRSLGAPIAASATHTVTPDALILESAFPDKAAVIRTQPVLRMLNVFGSYRFSTVELLRGFRKPVLVLHGERDSIIPFALGRELFDTLAEPKHFAAIRAADHNDFFEATDTMYWDPIEHFIDGL
jgi:pimeloyl-ACP methyl ester carboxylesterase